MINRSFLFALASFSLLVASRSEIVYDNSSDFSEIAYDTRNEFGDEIVLTGSERWLSEFSFEYYGDFTSSGDETARLRFYKNDAPLGSNFFPTPGTLLFDSGSFTIESGYKTIKVDDIYLELPESFTWTVEFGGLVGNENAGLLIYNGPAIGSSREDFWEKQEGDWRLLAFENLSANFAARVVTSATSTFRIEIKEIAFESGEMVATSSAVPGRLYELEYRTDLGPQGTWQSVSGSQLRATFGTVVLRDREATLHPFRFYRMKESTTSIALVNGQAVITSYAVPGETYRLEWTSNFSGWNALPGTVKASGSTVTFTIAQPPALPVFYRVVPI